MSPRQAVVVCAIVTMSMGATGIAAAQTFPYKAIRFVTGGPTGASGSAARFIAQGISGPIGQPVVVDHRRGGGGTQAEIVVKATPDGHTLLVSGSSLWVGPLMTKLPYDPIKDLSPVSLVGRTPLILVVHPSLPVQSVKDLIAFAKTRPGQLNYSTGGIGSTDHLGFEWFKSLTGINVIVVPYPSDAQQLTDLLSGQVQMTSTTPASIMEQVKLGKVRGLAVTSAQPSTLAPGLPTIAASGVPGFDAVLSVVMVSGANTPSAAIARLNQEVVRYLKSNEARDLFFKSGIEVVGGTPEQLAATMKSEIARWTKVIADAGIQTK